MKKACPKGFYKFIKALQYTIFGAWMLGFTIIEKNLYITPDCAIA